MDKLKRLLIDLSSVSWKSLLAGVDKEFGRKVEHEGKEVLINSAKYGYENALSHITTMMNDYGIVPINVIIVREGQSSKEHRKYIAGSNFDYKGSRGSRPPEAYEQFNLLNDMICDALCNVGASMVTQDYIEADDVIAYLAQNLEGERYILSSDGDLAALIAPDVHLIRNGELDPQPYGPIRPWDIATYKALVGDSSDSIPGVKGFGPKTFMDFFVGLTDEDMDYLRECLENRKLDTLAGAVDEHPQLKKILAAAQSAYASYDCARLYPEMINTLRRPMSWRVGMQLPAKDERLKKWGQQCRVVTSDNYAAAYQFVRDKVTTSPYFCLDLETTVGDESDEWIAAQGKKNGVDVIGSRIVSCALSLGDNLQYALYFSVEHRDTNNITLEQLHNLLALVPKDKMTIAHNAAGFELPVMFNAWGGKWQDNGWRGFFPNMVDTRIGSSYVDENRQSHGLKGLSKDILGYEQTTYDEVTGGRKMHELSAAEVVAYGVDDVYTAGALWNYFRTVMELEKTLDTFMRFEQKPMYLQAMGYVNGIRFDMRRLRELSDAADAAFAEHEKVLNDYLIAQGWDGTQCPEITELSAATAKQLVGLLLGIEFKSMVRTLSKLTPIIAELEHDDAPLLARMLDDGDLAGLNTWVRRVFTGKPSFDSASPKQVGKLVYETMGLPVRLRNKVTAVMRAKGIREGTPRTDEDCLKLAINNGDATEDQAAVLKALIEMKGINTARGLYYKPYPGFVHWKTGKVHPELRQSSTVTRRFSAANPNLQQLNAEGGGIRSVVLPHHRHAVVVSLDESAQEVRCVADLSGDANLMTCYVGAPDQLRDVHSIVACKVAGVSYEEFRRRLKKGTEEEAKTANSIRQRAKITLFSWVYGASAPKIAETLGISESEAQGYVDALNAQFPDLARWKVEIEAFTERHGYAPLMHNTRRHLAKQIMSDDKWEASKARRQASNAAIQSSCALQMKQIMSSIWDSTLFEDRDVQWYASIHDEVLLSVAAKDAVPATKVLHDIMCAPFLSKIPSASSIGFGRDFGNLVELGEVFDEQLIRDTIADLMTKKA